VIWTQAFEDAVARYVERGPGVTTISKTVIVNALAGQQRATCMNNLSQLGQVHLIQTMENRAKAQKYSGPAMWLAMRKSGVEIHRGEERTVLCPCDLDVYVPATDAEIKRWDDVDLAKPAEGLCSYAGRDFVKFPIDVKSTDKQAIGACLHHDGGAVVVFDGGDAYFMTLEELGLASEAEKTVGPESKSPVLRVLR
jgi:hypothetical protein